jgi:hypothetical protein
MFFVKAAFWIFLILLLMPSNDREKSDFYVAAGRTMSDLGSFCSRNPEVCNKTTSIVETVVQKVRTTLQMLEDMVRSDGAGRDPRDLPPQRTSDRRIQGDAHDDMPVSSIPDGSQNTLRPEDMRPAWRGPGRV